MKNKQGRFDDNTPGAIDVFHCVISIMYAYTNSTVVIEFQQHKCRRLGLIYDEKLPFRYFNDIDFRKILKTFLRSLEKVCVITTLKFNDPFS